MKQQREELARELVRKDNQMKEMQQRLESGEGCKYKGSATGTSTTTITTTNRSSTGSRPRSQSEPAAKSETLTTVAITKSLKSRVCSACLRQNRHPEVQIATRNQLFR